MRQVFRHFPSLGCLWFLTAKEEESWVVASEHHEGVDHFAWIGKRSQLTAIMSKIQDLIMLRR